MDTSREDRIRDIFEEVGRSTDLDRALTLIADQVAADLSAPTCKIWVVKRGDICERCPLAASCSNRQMCMHLAAASGAAVDKEYPRIPMSALNASIIARGSTLDFSDPKGAAEKLFGLQHGSSGDSRDSVALYPLKGASGTIGLIGVFNHRLIEPSEMEDLSRLVPAAIAAVRTAELHIRCDTMRARLDKEMARVKELEQSSAQREHELEDAVAHLTHQVAQMQVEREQLIGEREISQTILLQIEEENAKLHERIDELSSQQLDSTHTYSEMVAHIENERRQNEEENAWLKGRVAALEQSLAESLRRGETTTVELVRRNGEAESLKAERARREAEFNLARETAENLQQRIALIEEANAALRENNSALTESLDELEQSLRMAEDARARLEQSRAEADERVSRTGEEIDRLMLERERLCEENERIAAELALLRNENSHLAQELERGARGGASAEEVDKFQAEIERLQVLSEELKSVNEDLMRSRAQDQISIEELQQENIDLLQINAELRDAFEQIESRTARLEESAMNLREQAKLSESDLAETHRALAEENRRLAIESRTKAGFMANLAHELRTPLNAIIGFTSLMLEDRPHGLHDRHYRSMERVSRNARDMLEFINNVLDLAKIEAGRMEVQAQPVDIGEMAERALEALESLREGSAVSLALEIAEDLPVVYTDRMKLQQILTNLISNAIKFTPEGEVRVSARREGDSQVRIEVSDTGVGIDEEDLPKLFEEFQQVGSYNRASRTGTGLGLAITRRLTHLLGGDISVSSRPGEGSVFSITLPVETESCLSTGPETISPPGNVEMRALAVSADPASLYLMKKYLTEEGYSVAATEDGERGLEIARLDEPSLILFDMDTSASGSEALRQIAVNQSSFVIAVSSDTETERRALEAGARASIRKPLERAGLARVLRRRDSPTNGHILIGEDDPDALDLVTAIMEGSGYEVRTARNGRAVISEIDRAKPDAIILDVMLPEMDGFEVVHRLSLNEDWRSIPVVLFTACNLSYEERRALNVGKMKLIQKGNFSREQLISALKEITNGIHIEEAMVTEVAD